MFNVPTISFGVLTCMHTYIGISRSHVLEEVVLTEVPVQFFLGAVSVEVRVAHYKLLCQYIVGHHRDVDRAPQLHLLVHIHHWTQGSTVLGEFAVQQVLNMHHYNRMIVW